MDMFRDYMAWFLLVATALVTFSAKAATMTRPEVEKIVHEYIVKNPEVLIEATQALQRKKQDQMLEQAKTAILENSAKIFSSKSSPANNGKDATINLVEFFDYQCGHCRRMSTITQKLATDDGKIRVIYKELPIFGESSEYASRVALAAGLQDKYEAMHQALMQLKTPFTNDAVMAAAKKAGLNIKKLKTDMETPAVEQELKDNMGLAQALGIVGTPAFVISSQPFNKDKEMFFLPGATNANILSELVAKVRKNG